MRVRAAETPKYATKQIRSEDTIPMGMALWGFFTSSPGGRQRAKKHSYRDQKTADQPSNSRMLRIPKDVKKVKKNNRAAHSKQSIFLRLASSDYVTALPVRTLVLL